MNNKSNLNIWHVVLGIAGLWVALIITGKAPVPAFLNAAATPGAIATQMQVTVNGTPTPLGSPVPVVLDSSQGPYLTQVAAQMPVITQTPSTIDKIFNVTVQPTVDPILLMNNLQVYRVPYDTSYMTVHEAPFVGIVTVSKSLGDTATDGNTYKVEAVRVITVPVGVQFSDIMDDVTLSINDQTKMLDVTINVGLCALHPWEYRDDLSATDISVPGPVSTWWYEHRHGTTMNYAGVTTDAMKAAWNNAVTAENFNLVMAQGQGKLAQNSSGWYTFVFQMFNSSAKAVGLNGANVSVTVRPADANSQLICGTTNSVFTAQPVKQ